MSSADEIVPDVGNTTLTEVFSTETDPSRESSRATHAVGPVVADWSLAAVGRERLPPQPIEVEGGPIVSGVVVIVADATVEEGEAHAGLPQPSAKVPIAGLASEPGPLVVWKAREAAVIERGLP